MSIDLPTVVFDAKPTYKTFSSLEERGYTQRHIDELRKIFLIALQSIYFSLPGGTADELFPASINAYAAESQDAIGKAIMRRHVVGNELVEGRITDRQIITVDGIALCMEPDTVFTDPERVRQTLTHEILHVMLEAAIASSKGLKETAIYASQKTCGVPIASDPYVLDADPQYGWRTDDFAYANLFDDLSERMYMDAKFTAYALDNNACTDVAAHLAVAARKESRVVRFAEFLDALEQASCKSAQTLEASPIAKCAQEGECAQTFFARNKTGSVVASTHLVEVKTNPHYLQPGHTDRLRQFSMRQLGGDVTGSVMSYLDGGKTHQQDLAVEGHTVDNPLLLNIDDLKKEASRAQLGHEDPAAVTAIEIEYNGQRSLYTADVDGQI